MAQKPGFMNYVAAAFNARPLGMFVAPNWVGLAALGLLGIANPGFWVLGAGLERRGTGVLRLGARGEVLPQRAWPPGGTAAGRAIGRGGVPVDGPGLLGRRRGGEGFHAQLLAVQA